MLSIADALKTSASLMQVSDTARLDVEVLLAAVMQKDRAFFYTWPEKILSEAEAAQFTSYVEQRQQGQPVAYIIGHREFWSLDLQVNSSTLIPRPETELLVETVLALHEQDAPNTARKVIDLGTGTGAIALSLAVEQPTWEVYAVDNSAAVCELAESNRQKHQLQNVQVQQSHWFDSLSLSDVDVIVSNPPYIDQHDEHLQQGDVRFEPLSALVADNEGMSDIETIVEQSCHILKSQGWLLIEHGFQQGDAVRRVFENAGFTRCETQQDMAGLDRITLGQLP